MMNNEMMTLNLTRGDVCSIRLALLSVIHDMQDELADENTSEARKKNLANSIEAWKSLRAEIIKQFDEQDA